MNAADSRFGVERECSTPLRTRASMHGPNTACGGNARERASIAYPMSCSTISSKHSTVLWLAADVSPGAVEQHRGHPNLGRDVRNSYSTKEAVMSIQNTHPRHGPCQHCQLSRDPIFRLQFSIPL